jgi:uncharacterized protein YjbI with pentapeptide repeats
MRDTRQRRSQAELLVMGTDAATREKIEKTIDRLVDGRLLTIDRVNDENVIDLSHEALMQGWKRFMKWREIDRDLRRLVDKIEEARREWQVQKQQRKYLLEGRLLGDAKRLQKDRSESLVGDVRSFVIRSLEHQKRRRLQSVGWLIIPILVLGIPSEYFWRKEVVKQDYYRIENSKGGEQTSALSRLREGCHAKVRFVWVPIYFRERLFGNCGELNYVNLSNSNLSEVDLSGADLRYAKLINVKLDQANLRGANLEKVDMGRASLNNTDLTDTNLDDANLGGADLQGARLIHARLRGTNLKSANLMFTDLSNADLSRADLNNAKLEDANLSDVNFECNESSYEPGDNFHCTDIKNITWSEYTHWKGVKGWESVINIPLKLKKHLKLP